MTVNTLSLPLEGERTTARPRNLNLNFPVGEPIYKVLMDRWRGQVVRTLVVTLLGVVGTCITAASQVPTAFEVASVRSNPNPATNPSYSYPPSGGFSATLPLDFLIVLAYETTGNQVVNIPAWGRTEKFDIDARSAAPVTRAEANAMLRTLLAERFALVVRKDSHAKSMRWVLRMAHSDRRLGPSIRQAEMDCIRTPQNAPLSERQIRRGLPVPCGQKRDIETLAAGSVPFTNLLLAIQVAVGEEVIDRTDLTGLFDYYARIPPAAGTWGLKEEDRPSIFTAVQEELGLKLEREEVTRELFYVERIARPTPN